MQAEGPADSSTCFDHFYETEIFGSLILLKFATTFPATCLYKKNRPHLYGSVKKKPPAVFSPFFRAHVLSVRSARKKGCGLATGRRVTRRAGGLPMLDFFEPTRSL
jgi:hypothetical protein